MLSNVVYIIRINIHNHPSQRHMLSNPLLKIQSGDNWLKRFQHWPAIKSKPFSICLMVLGSSYLKVRSGNGQWAYSYFGTGVGKDVMKGIARVLIGGFE